MIVKRLLEILYSAFYKAVQLLFEKCFHQLPSRLVFFGTSLHMRMKRYGRHSKMYTIKDSRFSRIQVWIATYIGLYGWNPSRLID